MVDSAIKDQPIQIVIAIKIIITITLIIAKSAMIITVMNSRIS
jgi:hypothetical protein